MDGLLQITDPRDQALDALETLWSVRGTGLAGDALIHDSDEGGLTLRGMAALRHRLLTGFPDMALHVEDVILGADIALARMVLTATHSRTGPHGPATHRGVAFRCGVELRGLGAAVEEAVLIRDQGALPPLVIGEEAAARWRGPGGATHDAPDPWAAALSDIMSTAMEGDLSILHRAVDPAAEVFLPGGISGTGPEPMDRFWLSLRSAFPSAAFTLRTVLGRDEALGAPCAALRWDLNGCHDGWGRYGAPTGSEITVPGMCFAEFGPRGLRRFWALVDDVAVQRRIRPRPR